MANERGFEGLDKEQRDISRQGGESSGGRGGSSGRSAEGRSGNLSSEDRSRGGERSANDQNRDEQGRFEGGE